MLEIKRGTRSRQPFLLMFLEMKTQAPADTSVTALEQVLSVVSASTRETDATGWYQDKCRAGVLFTEINIDRESSIQTTMLTRVTAILRNHLGSLQLDQVSLTFSPFPEPEVANPPLLPLPAKKDSEAVANVCRDLRPGDFLNGAVADHYYQPRNHPEPGSGTGILATSSDTVSRFEFGQSLPQDRFRKTHAQAQ